MIISIFCQLFMGFSSNIHWKDWCWRWNSNTLANWCEELTRWKRPWCWERLKAGGEGDNRGWDGWMASLMWWTWVRVGSGNWWWTGRPGMLQSMESQRVRHDWVTEQQQQQISFKAHFQNNKNHMIFLLFYEEEMTSQASQCYSLILNCKQSLGSTYTRC